MEVRKVMERFYHTFDPLYNDKSKILILGSFPSVKSRDDGFYYAHPRNRFWSVMSRLLEAPFPETADERRDLLLSRRIALWDVAESCEVVGSGDNTIRDVEPVDIRRILGEASIEAIFCNGSTAWALYMELLYPITQTEAIKLPSTSPANARVRDEALFLKWKAALGPYLENL